MWSKYDPLQMTYASTRQAVSFDSDIYINLENI